jgi:hypothetical protein
MINRTDPVIPQKAAVASSSYMSSDAKVLIILHIPILFANYLRTHTNFRNYLFRQFVYFLLQFLDGADDKGHHLKIVHG